MITLQREYDKNVLYELKEHFTEDGGYDKETCFNEIMTQMNCPDAENRVCIITGRENGELKGFLLANAIYDRVYLNQAYSMVGKEYAFRAMDMLKDWGKSIGLKELRFNTEHGSTVFRSVRNYGFDIISVEMGCKL